jgi:hypothetical protein
MKKMLVLVILFLFFSTVSYAQEKKKDFELTVDGIYVLYNDKDLRDNGTGVKATARYKWFYLWGSWESTELRLSGQQSGGIDVFGFGIGTKLEIVKGLKIFLDGGYYIPNAELEKNASDPAHNEGIKYKWYKDLEEKGLLYLYPKFPNYSYELKGNFGATIGAEFVHEIYKGVNLNLFGGYRFLNLREDWDAYPNENLGFCIQTKEKRDFSGGMFGAGLTYRF